jgi:chromosomal replication initiation ATPase DnaA
LRQIPLELPHRIAIGREDFFVGEANAAAIAWLDRWPDWPGGGLAVYGPPGSGKTHLIEVWRARSAATRIEPAALPGADLEALAGAPAVAVDGIDGPLAPTAATQLFHLYNRVRAAGHTLALAARGRPGVWAGLPDLASRVATFATVELAAPDDLLLMAVMHKQFADRQVVVGEDLLRYAAARIERSFAAAQAFVAALDRAALGAKRAPSIALARAVLESEPARPDL